MSLVSAVPVSAKVVYLLPSLGMGGAERRIVSLTDCPAGSAEIVRHGDNGLLVPVADATAMAGAIERVLSDVDLRDRLVRGGTQTAETFLIERTIRKYEQLLLSQVPAR